MAGASLRRGCSACEDLQVACKLLDGACGGRGKLFPPDPAGFLASARAQALAGITTLFPLLSRPDKGCRRVAIWGWGTGKPRRPQPAGLWSRARIQDVFSPLPFIEFMEGFGRRAMGTPLPQERG